MFYYSGSIIATKITFKNKQHANIHIYIHEYYLGACIRKYDNLKC